MSDSDVRGAPRPAPEPERQPAEVIDLGPVREALIGLAPEARGTPSDDASAAAPAPGAAPPVPAPVPPEAEAVDLSPVARAMRQLSPAAATAAGGQDAPLPASAARSVIGVLLVNLGTPDAPTPSAVRAYLREFLSDRRVIEKDSVLWRLVLNAIILPLRPRAKAKAYRAIWNVAANESPLKTVTRAQAEKLAADLAEAHPGIMVDWAMRYGSPSIASRIEALAAQGCDRLLLMPLYPQYAAATTATVCDAAFRKLARMRRQPALRVLPAYYDDPAYIDALAASIEAHLLTLDFVPDVILASYHGMPQEYVEKGDPYERQCIETTRLLRARLGRDESTLMMTFQSRFGRAKWLEPYTDKTVRKLARNGVKNLAVVTPGFAADCLETLEEIAIENGHLFKRNGGRNFTFIPCLNDSDAGMSVIRRAALRELRGWL